MMMLRSPKRLEIHNGTQRSSNETLNLVGPARRLTLADFPLSSGGGGAGQHRVFSRYPSLSAAAQKRRHRILDCRGA